MVDKQKQTERANAPSRNCESSVKFYRVPAEVIKAWDRGEYFTGGVPSVSYKHLGTALRLRGLYSYTEDDVRPHNFKGIAKIELVGGRQLIMEGIRLWAANDKPDVKFWRTEFSHFLSEDKIICTYKVFDHDRADILNEYIGVQKLPNVKDSDAQAKFGFSDAAWHQLQQFVLSDDFARELSRVEAESTENAITRVMLHFDIPDFKLKRDQPITVQYRQLKSGGADISGDSRFERIDPE